MLTNKPKFWQTNQNSSKQTKFVCQNSALRQNLDKNQNLDKQINPFHIQIMLTKNVSQKVPLKKILPQNIPPKKFLPKKSSLKFSQKIITPKFQKKFQPTSQKISKILKISKIHWWWMVLMTTFLISLNLFLWRKSM